MSLADHVAAFAALLDDGDLDAPVAACPGWDVRALGDHLGGVHAWATHAITHGSPDHEESPAPVDDLADWYRDRAAALHVALEVDGPAWTMDEDDPTVAFWRRRQLHEVRMHLWDVRTALGLSDTIEADLALDGLAEVRDVFYPRQVRLGRIEPLGSTLVLRSDGGEGVRIGDGTEVVVHGTPDELLRSVWHRAPLDDLTEDPAARALLAAALTP